MIVTRLGRGNGKGRVAGQVLRFGRAVWPSVIVQCILCSLAVHALSSLRLLHAFRQSPRVSNVVAFVVVDTKSKPNVHGWEMSAKIWSTYFIKCFK